MNCATLPCGEGADDRMLRIRVSEQQEVWKKGRFLIFASHLVSASHGRRSVNIKDTDCRFCKYEPNAQPSNKPQSQRVAVA
jgi:hypothetical protein